MNKTEIKALAIEVVRTGGARPKAVIVEDVASRMRCDTDSETAKEAIYWMASDVVQSAVRSLAKADSAGSQPSLFAAFDRVQAMYSVLRDGVQWVVPVLLMTPEERENKAAELERDANGKRAHAKQLRELNEQLASMGSVQPMAKEITL